jgi:hypothetical protein
LYTRRLRLVNLGIVSGAFQLLGEL